MGPSTFEVGTTLGDYQIISVVGRGGMGKVFKVRNLLSDRIEAMKVLLPDIDPRADLAERFLREIKVVAALEHPGIASLRTALRANNQVLMIMEYVDGASLHWHMQQGRIEPARAVRFTQQELEALGYAHRRGVVHRDIKPSNILVTSDDRVKLTDFGIASRTGDPRLTTEGVALGSLFYMSPEQMKAEAVDARSDLYSLGVTLYEMLTGQPPVQLLQHPEGAHGGEASAGAGIRTRSSRRVVSNCREVSGKNSGSEISKRAAVFRRPRRSPAAEPFLLTRNTDAQRGGRS